MAQALLVQRKVEDEDEGLDEQRNRVHLTDRGRRHRQEEFEDEDEDEDNQQNKMKMSSDKDGDWNFDSARMLFCNTDSKAIQPSIFNRIREKEVKSGADQPKIIRLEALLEDEDLEDEDEQRNKMKMSSDQFDDQDGQGLIVKFHHSQLMVFVCISITVCIFIINSLQQRNKMKMNNGTLLVQRKMEVDNTKVYWDVRLKFDSARMFHKAIHPSIFNRVREKKKKFMDACFASEPIITRNIKDIIDFKLSVDQPKIISSEPIAADNSSLLTPDTTPEQTWRVASAAPQHMTGYLNHLIDYTPASGDQVIDTPNMGPLAVHGRGSVNTANITLQDVLYVPCLDANLVSTGQLAQLGYMITLGPYGCRIYKDDEDMPLVGEAHYVDGYLLELDFLRVRPSTN